MSYYKTTSVFDLPTPLSSIRTHTNQADIVMICFAVDSAASLDNVRQMWASEVRENLPDAPILLVGTKIDIRNSCSSPQISKSNKEKPPKTPTEFSTTVHGHALAESIGAEKYVECSAFTQENLVGVFEEVARLHMYPSKKRRRKRKKKKDRDGSPTLGCFGL